MTDDFIVSKELKDEFLEKCFDYFHDRNVYPPHTVMLALALLIDSFLNAELPLEKINDIFNLTYETLEKHINETSTTGSESSES